MFLFMILPSAFFSQFPKKSQFLFCQTIDMTLSRSAACSYLQEIVFYLFYYSFLKFSNILPLYFLLSELGAGLGGGSRGRSHLQCDTEAGSDSAGGQQGSKMAWGECAHLMSPSVMKLTKLFQKRDKESNAPNARQTDHTYENLMLFPLSEPVAVQNVKCWFLPKVEKSLPLESIMCKWFIKAIQLVVCRLLSSKTKKKTKPKNSIV